jgi:hypothetical protein
MSWLRIDDGFSEHHKIAELTDREFRVWIRVLCYSARNPNKTGRLSRAMRKEIVGLTAPITRRFITLGLLDQDADPGIVCVHDWRTYNPADPTAASRMKRHRDRNATVTDTVTEGVTPTVTETEHDRNGNGPSRGDTRARPVPSPTPKTKPRAVTSQETTPDHDPNSPGNAEEELHPDVATLAPQLQAVDW